MRAIHRNKETKCHTEGAAKPLREDWCICPYEHYKQYTPQCWAFWKSGQKKAITDRGVHQKACGRLTKHMKERFFGRSD